LATSLKIEKLNLADLQPKTFVRTTKSEREPIPGADVKVLNRVISTPVASVATVILGLVVAADLAAAAQPSQAQASAILSSCRSDYQSHCASVPPGGPEALQCLEKNAASLSPECQKAVNAVGGGVPAAPAASPATSAAAAAATSAAPATSSPPTAPAASAATTPASPASAALTATAAPATAAAPAKSAGQKAGAAPKKTVAAPPVAPPPAAAPAPPPVARAYRPRQKIFLLRTSCGGDVRALCPGVPLGGGRVIACLEAHAPSLSPNCQGVMAALAR
jgi:hypothetical protein